MNDIVENGGNKKFRWASNTKDARDISPEEIPTQSLFALAQRGLSHVGGNEVAAQVSTWRKTEEGKTASDEQVEAFASEKRAEKLAKILDGTLGVRTAAGPRVTGVEALMNAIAVERLRAKFKSYNEKTGKKVVLPTGENTVPVMGKEMTRADLIAAELRSGEAAIKAEAERRQAVQAEAADVGEDLFA